MTDLAIKEQVKDIRNATNKALKSKDAALAFLLAAGIIQTPPAKRSVESKKK